MTTKPTRKNKLWMPITAVALVLVVGVAAVTLRGGNGSDWAAEHAVYPVEQGPMTISVLATGSLRSDQAVTLKNETDQRTTITYLIEEGVLVEEGDLLVQLDSGDLEETRISREIQYEQARSNLVQAESDLEVVRQQAEADVDAARVEYELAQLDMEKYEAPEGEYAQQLRKAETNITLAEDELERAEDQLSGSQRLFEAGYITETELQADRLTYQRRKLDLELARGERNLLEQFASRRRLAELKSNVAQKEFELRKVKHRTKADVVDAEARLASRKLTYEREKERLARVKRQIEACEVRAPVAGMVVHGTSGQQRRRRSQEPLAEGLEVSPRQDLIRLPTADQMVADVQVHEAMLERVERDQRVRITTDALPGREFEGRVRRIAVMPDAQNMWLNPDLKVYNTEVEIIGAPQGLRPGMSCSAEILVAELEDAKYVPIQSVMRVAGEPTVYVPTPNGPQARPVEVGLDNNRMIQLVSGVERGEPVLLNPPLERAARPERKPAEQREVAEGEGEGEGSAAESAGGERGGDRAGGEGRRGGGDREGRPSRPEGDQQERRERPAQPAAEAAGEGDGSEPS